MEIFQYPHKTLTEVSTEWKTQDQIQGYDDIERFEHDMIKLMYDEKGMGLAANQIGLTKRFFAIGHESFDRFKNAVIIYNPRLISTSQEKVVDVEGCLSFRGVWLKVSRPKTCEVEYETKQGKKQTARLDGMESKCFQHELDHLEGITFNKRVSKLRWDLANKR